MTAAAFRPGQTLVVIDDSPFKGVGDKTRKPPFVRGDHVVVIGIGAGGVSLRGHTGQWKSHRFVAA